ncbi:hypothetical protein [Pseudomonas sp.]|uniref:hypothetical protein n=1 Tax=Pseudomonas sp. TaxID=306 RepID=UPI0025859EEB|nr:hypothetical protein [Pseudomonas sp.]
MRINMAHLKERSTSGGWINFAVFEASSTNGDNGGLLAHLASIARKAGLKVDQAALAYSVGGRIRFYGSPNLVDFLSKFGLPRWTHKLDT